MNEIIIQNLKKKLEDAKGRYPEELLEYYGHIVLQQNQGPEKHHFLSMSYKGSNSSRDR